MSRVAITYESADTERRERESLQALNHHVTVSDNADFEILGIEARK
jgi:hypothetical protein